MTGGEIVTEYQQGHILRQYRKGDLLGRGGFAKAYVFTQLDNGQVFAAKTIPKASLAKERHLAKLRTEIKIHRSLDHPHVVRFERYFEDATNVYILLELCTQQSLMELHRRKRRLSEEEVRFIMTQLVKGTKYMHLKAVIHRDLKLGNVFLDGELNVKIGDFGLAAQLSYDGERKTTMCGTPNYIAPEILNGGAGGGKGHSFEVDIWSLGVILFTLLTGSPPFETRDVNATYKRIRNLTYSFPPTLDISMEAKELVERILQTDPTRRPTLEDIERHPFFKRHQVPLSCPPSLFPAPPVRRQLVSSSSAGTLAGYGNRHANPTNYLGPATARAQAGAPTGLPKAAGTVKRTSSSPRIIGGPAPAGLGARSTSSPRIAGGVGVGVGVGGGIPSARSTNSPRTRATGGAGGLTRAASSPRIGGSGSLPPTLPSTLPSSMSSGLPSALPTPSTGGPPPSVPAAGLDSASAAMGKMPAVWVKKYADYTARYGLAYMLSNGLVGAVYNDMTRMIWDPKGGRVEYIARVRQEQPNGTHRRVDDLTVCTTEDYPEMLKKKITLIKYFYAHFQKTEGEQAKYPVVNVNLSPSSPREIDGHPSGSEDPGNARFPHVRSWSTNDRGLSFRLTNRLYQCFFADGVDVQLNTTDSKHALCSIRGENKRAVLVDSPGTFAIQVKFAVDRMRENSRTATPATNEGQHA